VPRIRRRRPKKKNYDDYVVETIEAQIATAKFLLENGKREWKKHVENTNTGRPDPRSDQQDAKGRQENCIPWKLSCQAKAKFTSRPTRRYQRLDYE
jgi:hypothetical protein